MKKLHGVIIGLLVITLFLEGVNIFLSNSLTSDSIAATKLRDEIAVIDETNQNIRSEILEFTSFDNVSSRAALLGFIESKDTISLDSPVEVATAQ